MNRIIKKMTVVFLSLAITLLAFPAGILTAYAGAGKITFSDPTASVGNQVSVTMKIASSDGTALNKADVMLEYDAQSLEFLSGTSANGGAGNVRVVGDAEAASQTTFSFTLKFKALKAGTSSITVKSQEVYDANGQAVTISHTGNSAVKVSGGSDASQDASLGSLTVSPGTLSPEFSAEVTEDTAVVPADVAKIPVSAPAHDGTA
ncbi:MAG: cohesin domain-containing protein, partial [Lachnospiraceae bacterium]